MRQHYPSSQTRTESFHANAAMLGHAMPRSAARVFVRLPAWVAVESNDAAERLAFVRDISPRGIFFYWIGLRRAARRFRLCCSISPAPARCDST